MYGKHVKTKTVDFERVKKVGRLDGFRTFDWGKLIESLPLGLLKRESMQQSLPVHSMR